MPRYDYRVLKPTPAAERVFVEWIEKLNEEFTNHDSEHRSNIVRDALHQLYLGRSDAPREPATGLAQQALIHSFDPRNATLEPEYYGDVDAVKYAERKPLIWFWMMYDRSPVGLNHVLGYRMRGGCGSEVVLETVNATRAFLTTDSGFPLPDLEQALRTYREIIIHEGSSISDYANVYSHAHDLNDGMIVTDHKTEIGPKARVTYHATVLSGVRVGEHGMVGSLGVASKDVAPFHIVGGIPAKPIKVKSIAPEELQVKPEQK